MLPHSDTSKQHNKGPIQVAGGVLRRGRRVLRGRAASTASTQSTSRLRCRAAFGERSELPSAMPRCAERVEAEGREPAGAGRARRDRALLWTCARWSSLSPNTLHIMHWPQVRALPGVMAVAKPDAVLADAGPPRYAGAYTSPADESFDRMLHARDPQSGIRNFDDVDTLARQAGFELKADHPMPANNRTIMLATGIPPP